MFLFSTKVLQLRKFSPPTSSQVSALALCFILTTVFFYSLPFIPSLLRPLLCFQAFPRVVISFHRFVLNFTSVSGTGLGYIDVRVSETEPECSVTCILLVSELTEE